MTTELITFLILAVVAIVTALGMLFSRNAVYAALFLILNFGTVAVFYLLLDAPFIALAQVTVYAGAIMVLFLFVIMLLGAEQTGRIPTTLLIQRVPFFLGALLIAEIILIFYNQRNNLPVMAVPAADFGTPTSVGEILFNQYLLPFEVTSILLLVAMIGAIVLSRPKA